MYSLLSNNILMHIKILLKIPAKNLNCSPFIPCVYTYKYLTFCIVKKQVSSAIFVKKVGKFLPEILHL